MKWPVGPTRVNQTREGAIWLAIRSRRNTTTFWSITRDKIIEIDKLPANVWPVLSLDESDTRVAVEKACTNKQARSLIRRKTGQVARIINRSSSGVVYGRGIYSMPDSHDVAPASMLIDQILPKATWPAHPFVVGFLLTVPESHNAILALWAGNVKRDLSIVEVTENAQQVEQIIDAFCRKHSIASDDSNNLLVFDLTTILNAVALHGSRLQPYPSFDDWFGIPVKRVWSTAAACSCGAALASVGAAAALVIHGQVIDHDYSDALQKTAQSKQVVVDLFKSNVSTVADRASVDYRMLFAKAQAAYAPGGLTSIHIDGQGSKVRYRLPIDRTGGGSTDAMAIDTTPYQLFKAARSRQVDGITPTVFVGSAGNELFFDYSIANNNRSLLNYLDH